MKREIQTLNGTITVNTFITKSENGWESNSFKDFSLELTNVAQKKKENVQAIVIKPLLYNGWSYRTFNFNYKLDNTELQKTFADVYVFDEKVLMDKDVLCNRFLPNIVYDYLFIRKLKECCPEHYKYIELETRKSTLSKLFSDGVDGIIANTSELFKEFKGFDSGIDKAIFGETLFGHEIIASFDGYSFVALYVIGHLLAELANRGIKEVYFVSSYDSITVYYDGISKKDIKQITEQIVQDFNKEFSTYISLENPGVKNFKYIPYEDTFVNDRFGNKIGVGDLVLSPQGSDSGGSWVDPIIVKGVQNDRIIPDVIDRSYYLANRCILLRSVHGVEPKYGDKDFLQGKD